MFLTLASMATPKIILYTHTACPFAQRVAIALEASGMPFDKQEVNLYGSGGFDKSALKAVEKAGGLSAKGYIPVMKIDDEVIRESSVLVQRVAEMSSSVKGATSLQPELPELSNELIELCNELPKQARSRQLDDLCKRADAAIASSGAFLAGETFSVADACLLPFLQRVESEGLPNNTPHLREYYDRCTKLPAFSKTIASSWWWWW